uniref:Uncharacterized protein n=1 Tax=Mola mola TaxID=94237 RepID=A0A3Q3WNW7_MOLML
MSICSLVIFRRLVACHILAAPLWFVYVARLRDKCCLSFSTPVITLPIQSIQLTVSAHCSLCPSPAASWSSPVSILTFKLVYYMLHSCNL